MSFCEKGSPFGCVIHVMTPVHRVSQRRWRVVTTSSSQSPWTIGQHRRDGFHPPAGVTQLIRKETFLYPVELFFWLCRSLTRRNQPWQSHWILVEHHSVCDTALRPMEIIKIRINPCVWKWGQKCEILSSVLPYQCRLMKLGAGGLRNVSYPPQTSELMKYIVVFLMDIWELYFPYISISACLEDVMDSFIRKLYRKTKLPLLKSFPNMHTLA